MSALPSYKEIIELLKKGATIEAQEKIMELREKALELQEENLRLREELTKLQKAIDLEKTLSFDGAVYWMNKGETKQGPYCPKCHDTKALLVHLHKDGPGWFCYECTIHFGPHSSLVM
ncbi:MAG: hypothetical protein HZA88_00925 [Verrucomicrobia bacterium]|nr:hypothetical protein [Verrucomicrobiota bacterium]